MESYHLSVFAPIAHDSHLTFRRAPFKVANCKSLPIFRPLDTMGSIEDVSIKLIDKYKVSHESNLLDKEGQWAYHFKSIKPQGLNNSDFFFNQTRSNRESKR